MNAAMMFVSADTLENELGRSCCAFGKKSDVSASSKSASEATRRGWKSMSTSRETSTWTSQEQHFRRRDSKTVSVSMLGFETPVRHDRSKSRGYNSAIKYAFGTPKSLARVAPMNSRARGPREADTRR